MVFFVSAVLRGGFLFGGSMPEPGMAVAEPTAPTEGVWDGPPSDASDESAVLDAPDNPIAEATTEEPADTSTVSVDAVAEGAAPEAVVDAERLSRRQRWEAQNKEFADEIRAEERTKTEEAIARAADLESQQKQQAETWQALQEQAAQWNPDPATMAEIDRATKQRDWETLAKHNLYSVDDALDRLSAMEEQKATNTAMLGYWQQVFMGSTGQAWKSAAERTGAKWDDVKAEQDVGKSLVMLLDAERASVEAEYKGRIDELETALANSRSRSGASVSSPETGGQAQAGSSGYQRYLQDLKNGDTDKWTQAEIDRVTSAEMDRRAQLQRTA